MATPHDHLDKLLEIARAGPSEELYRLVQETLCINEIHPMTHVPIVETLAKEGHAEVVRYLVAQGASKNFACRGAAQGGQEALMNELLEQGASKDYAVRGAASGGFTELMWRLIQIGADLNQALFGASQNGGLTVIEALIAKGAKPSYVLYGAIWSGDRVRARASMHYSRNPVSLQHAAFCGQVKLLNPLKAHCDQHKFPELVACYLARGGYETPFLERYGKQSHYLAWGIRGAAMGGHLNSLNNLIQHAIQNALLDEKIALKWAVTGGAMGNHSKLVDDLIARGATVEDALLGAAIRKRQALMNRLIAQGIASGQLRKDIAVRAAAIAKRYDLMNGWLIEGASVDQALRGVCCRQEDIEIAKTLCYSKGASLKWALIGYKEGYAEEIALTNREFSQLLPPPNNFYLEYIQQAAENGYYGYVQQRLEMAQGLIQLRKKVLNAAVLGAARGGFRSNVKVLIKLGAGSEPAMKGAVEASDRYLIEFLIPNLSPFNAAWKLRCKVMHAFFKTACATDQEDLVQWMMYNYGRGDFAGAITGIGSEVGRVQALSMIQSTAVQLEIAHEAKVIHLITAAQIAKKANVSSQIAFALMQMNNESLWCALNVFHRVAPGMPIVVKLKLFSFVAASPEIQIPEREIPNMMRGARVGMELQKLNATTPEEEGELQTITTRLKRSPQQRAWYGEKKSTQVEMSSSSLLSDRTRALGLQRHTITAKSPFLARSLQDMMHQFDKYQNLYALSLWIKACEKHLKLPRTPDHDCALQLKNLRIHLDAMREFRAESCNPAVLARYLQTEFEGVSLYSILKTLPYWNDCATHFPNMVKVLEESAPEMERVAEVRSSRGCGF